MFSNRSVLAIIPARGGSKSVPHKNIKLLGGEPLIAYTIGAALSSNYIDRTILSTDSKEIARTAESYGAEVIERPYELAQDDTPSLLVFQHAINYLETVKGFLPDILVLLQPTSPLRITEDIDEAVRKFLEIGCDSIVSVCEAEHPPHWMYTMEDDRLKPIIKGSEKITRRQDAPKVYRLNGAVWVTSKDIIMKQNRIHGDDTRAYIMPIERSIDIDTELDFRIAELLMRERQCS